MGPARGPARPRFAAPGPCLAKWWGVRQGRSGAEDVRSTLTRRPSRSYTLSTSRQAASSRHARSPWAVRRPPVPIGPDRRPARATPRSRTRRGIPATLPATPDTGHAVALQTAWVGVAGRGGQLVLQHQERPYRVVALLWRPAVPDPSRAGLPPFPVTRLSLRVRQRHDYSTPLRNGPVTGGSAPGRSRRRASADSTGAALQQADLPDNGHADRRAAWGGTGA